MEKDNSGPYEGAVGVFFPKGDKKINIFTAHSFKVNKGFSYLDKINSQLQRCHLRECNGEHDHPEVVTQTNPLEQTTPID